MIATFKETLTSITSNNYGQVIITKSVRSVLWYWTQYVLLFSLIPLILAVVFLTYITPQLPKFIRGTFNQSEIGIRSKRFYAIPDRKFIFGSQEFLLVYDPQSSTTHLDNALSGVLITPDKLYLKTPEGIQETNFSDIPEFSLSAPVVADWISSHKHTLWFLIVTASLLLTAFAASFYWLFRVSTFLLWSAAFWVIAILFQRRLEFTQVFRITVYAAVPSLILSSVLFVAPNPVLSIVNLVLFLYFALSWLGNIKIK